MAQKIQPYNEFNIDWVDTDLLKKKHTIHVHCKIQKEQGQDVSALRGGGGGGNPWWNFLNSLKVLWRLP